MRKLTASVPHSLGRAEARRRIVEAIPQLRGQLGGLARVEERWDGDVMSFTGSAMGTSVSGKLWVENDVVRIEVELPWALAFFAGTVQQSLETETRKLLESR
jgi:Putative polyhydroxyalkanoic acid system protein (PHA_gran_rgn)